MKKLFIAMTACFISLLNMKYVHAQHEQKLPPPEASGNLSMPETHKSAHPQHNVPPYKFEYAAQFVCGIQKEPENTRLAKGFYLTSIMIHNPNDTDVRLSKNLVLTYPLGEQKMGKVMPLGEDLLRSGEAMEITGEEIQKQLFPDGFPASYIKGMLVVRSMSSLDVSALYETATVNNENRIEALTDIEVKQIVEREIMQKDLPDLIIRDFDANQLSADCYDWPETCVTRVSFTVENTGIKDAGSFTIRVVFDPSQSVVVTQAVVGLEAGASRSFTVKSPPGRNCFDPDCSVCITVDSENKVTEADEKNNYLCVTKSEQDEFKRK